MINFDSIMRLASNEALYNVSNRVSDESFQPALGHDLDPEMKSLVKQNRINIILIEEMVKSALKHYHRELENEKRNESRLKF